MSERRWTAIHELVHRYAVLVDERDLDGAARLFVDDAELVLPTPPRTLTPVRELRGRAEIRAGLDALNDTLATRHGVLAVAVNPAGDSGTVTAVAHHLLVRDTGLVDLVWHLRYRDRYRRTGGGWRFARRELWLDWIESRRVETALEGRVA
jgi:ketosteroid isomerase-like protein